MDMAGFKMHIGTDKADFKTNHEHPIALQKDLAGFVAEIVWNIADFDVYINLHSIA